MFPLNKGYMFQCFQWRQMFGSVGKSKQPNPKGTRYLSHHVHSSARYQTVSPTQLAAPGRTENPPNKKPAVDPTIDISKQQPKAKAHRTKQLRIQASTPSESAAAAAAAPPSSSSSSTSPIPDTDRQNGCRRQGPQRQDQEQSCGQLPVLDPYVVYSLCASLLLFTRVPSPMVSLAKNCPLPDHRTNRLLLSLTSPCVSPHSLPTIYRHYNTCPSSMIMKS